MVYFCYTPAVVNRSNIWSDVSVHTKNSPLSASMQYSLPKIHHNGVVDRYIQKLLIYLIVCIYNRDVPDLSHNYDQNKQTRSRFSRGAQGDTTLNAVFLSLLQTT